MSAGAPRIALLHDELTRRGGAEIVLEELIRTFPDADIFALYAGQPSIVVDGRRYTVCTSFLQRFPRWFRYHPRRLLPLLSTAAEQFDLSSYDIVLTSASGFAKAVVTRVAVPHICYCHTPTRYLWDSTHEVVLQHPVLIGWLAKIVLHYLRLADFAAAQRVDVFVANSFYTAARIHKYYRRRSTVVYPPIDTAFYTPSPGAFSSSAANSYFLCVGRLTTSKRFDQAIRVCEKLRFPLVVVGIGPQLQQLRRLTGSTTRLMGWVSAEKLRKLYRNARALLQPGTEDFSMACAEALACGTPVIAYGRGGAQEVVVPGESGVLYWEPHEEMLAEAIRQFLLHGALWQREKLQQSVLKFTRQRFRDRMHAIVDDALSATQV